MASIDKETEVYYNNYFSLFRNEGYTQLIEDLKNNAAAINSVDSLKDEADMYYRKGQLNVLASLINFETTIDSSFKELTEEDD